jgi:hypothetical protein
MAGNSCPDNKETYEIRQGYGRYLYVQFWDGVMNIGLGVAQRFKHRPPKLVNDPGDLPTFEVWG